MADEERDTRAVMGSGVDYKTLFMGACTLIVLFGGAAFRAWDSSNQRESEHAVQKLDRIEERLAEMEARQTEYRFRIEHLEKLLERR